MSARSPSACADGWHVEYLVHVPDFPEIERLARYAVETVSAISAICPLPRLDHAASGTFQVVRRRPYLGKDEGL